jgi:hypothetical protein
MAGGREFDPGKFKEMVLFFAERSAPEVDPRMSRVKLNKLLYRADFEAFRLLGQSITGETYIWGEFGPMASHLPMAETELGNRGYLEYELDKSGPQDRKVPIAREPSDPLQFEPEERVVMEAALVELADRGGKAASAWSHEESVGWRLRDEHPEIREEPIPYEIDLVASGPAPASAVARLRDRVLAGHWD